MKLFCILSLCLLLGSEYIGCDINHYGIRKFYECSKIYVLLPVDSVKYVEMQSAAAVRNNYTIMGSSRVKEANYILKQGRGQDVYPQPAGCHAVSPSGTEEAFLEKQLWQQHVDPRWKPDEMFMAAGKLKLIYSTTYRPQ